MPRIKKENVSLDYGKTKEFFQSRAAGFSGSDCRVITSYADKAPDVSRQRDELEQQVLSELATITIGARVLDIGCGAGRLASFFESHSAEYLGIDYSDALIEIAEKNFSNPEEHIRFQVLSVDELEPEVLIVKPPFDLILVTGLIAYLNEDSTGHLFTQLAKLGSPSAAIYLREPISLMQHRLTLKDHFSEELQQEYNAIYRTETELTAYFERYLYSEGFRLQHADFLYPEALHQRAETKHKYFFFVRSTGG
ncbi:MAG: class I SAM-dependent methyltransferase [Gammaproteobacteria bacterium]|nr:class I SAM-dependent methyltransferase [Gammaproteobacteria bacterium]